jgi:hypothetical protein
MLFLFLIALSAAGIAGAAAIGSVNLDWSQWAAAMTNPHSEFGELV